LFKKKGAPENKSPSLKEIMAVAQKTGQLHGKHRIKSSHCKKNKARKIKQEK
jgi:hypothetical protein